MAEQKMTRVRVKFMDSIAGLRDPSPATLNAKYARIEEAMKDEKTGKLPRYNEREINAAVELERKRDEAIIRTGFPKDWSFKPGDEANVNAAIAEEWEAAGICSILPAINENRKGAGA